MEQILIIFNSHSVNKPILEVLEQDYNVEVYTRGIDAYTWIHSGNVPDLILTDDTLTDMDVKELISRFKNSSYYSEIPILVLLQSENLPLLDELLNTGANDYVKHPVDLELLMVSVRSLLLKK